MKKPSILLKYVLLFAFVVFTQTKVNPAFAQTGRALDSQLPNLQTNRWPKHTVRILVGFPPGSTPDMIARTIAEPLTKSLGQTVIVENHVGVSGNLAAQMVSKAQDDHTLGLMINGNLTTAKLLYPSLEFEPLKDFTPISLIADSPLVLVASVNLPSGKAFIKVVQSQGKKWNYGSVGTGSMAHLAMEALKASNPGFEPVHIPYPGNPGVLNALMSGEIQMALVPVGVAMPLIHGEKIQAIGLLGGRSILAPSTATLTELGLSGAATQLKVWDALVGPKSLSGDAQTRLSKELRLLLQSSELRTQLFNQGWILRGGTDEALKNVMSSEYLLMQSLISKNKIYISQ